MPCTFLISAVALILSLAMSPASRPSQNQTPEPPPDMVQANAAVQGFVQALRDSEWTKAIGYCSPKVQNAAKTYPSPEAFFRDVVPIKQVVTQTRNPIYALSKCGGWGFCNLDYTVAELEPDPAGKWSLQIPRLVWWYVRVEKADSRSIVDFPTTLLRSHIETRLNELRRGREKAIAEETELEPKLKAVHTRLTPLAERFQAGGPVLFRLELINDGPAKLAYSRTMVMFFPSMIVKTSQGKPVPYTGGAAQTYFHYEIIDPGQTVILLDKWDLATRCRLTEPGHYTVQFRGEVGIAEADPHKTIQVGRPPDRIETIPAAGRWSRRLFPSNIVEIEVVATQPAASPTK